MSSSWLLVHRPARAYPRPVPAVELTVAAPPVVGGAGSGLAGWLQYLVPLLGSGGSVAFLFAVPGPRPGWLVALVVAGAVASVALGLGLRLVERRTARRARRRERARYLVHLDRVATEAARVAAAQLAAADHLHPDPPRLLALCTRSDRLWERRPTDHDFLTVRVGRGPAPLAAPVRLDPGPGPLVEVDPELLSAAEDMVGRARSLPDAPVAVPLRRLGVLAVTGPPHRTRPLVRSMLCQLAALHAPDDVRVLAGFAPTALPEWDWLKWLPHARDPTPDRPGAVPTCLLGLATSQVAALLDREVRSPHPSQRPDMAPAVPGSAGPSGRHLVVVVEPDHGPGAALPGPALEELLERAGAAGVAVVWLASDTAGEPSELAARIRVHQDGTASFEETRPGGRLIDGIRPDAAGIALAETLARRLAPLRLDRRPATPVPSGPVRLLDLLGLGDGPIDPATTWRPRPRAHLLRVPIGARPSGEPLVLDLKEAAEDGIGPHGLVVGATGSGKSELLRSVVAGLAATHPPERLAFVLVDFKGGAAFADLARLPQVAGLITNLQADLSMVDRAMAALRGEQARRQRILHQAGNQPDLRSYWARRQTDPTLEPLPHLLIVVDEFGELLSARPEFLEVFAAIGRVGRSLGMHLLLASQRLDEGRLHGLDGHLRFRICLRTSTTAESTAVLGTPDAHSLPPTPGAALLKVDATPPLRFTAALVSTSRHHPAQPAPTRTAVAAGAGRSARRAVASPDRWPSGAAVEPDQGSSGAAGLFTPVLPAARPATPPMSGSIPGPGPGPPLRADRESTAPGVPSDLERLAAGLSGAGRPAHQVWLPPLAAVVPLDGLLERAQPGWLRVPVGVVDRPLEQAQEPLILDLSGAGGHLAVVGAPRTGKSTLLCTIVSALAATNPPDAVQAYAIDLGGGLLHRLAGLPHVGAVCAGREPGRVRRLVRELRSVVGEREQGFRDLEVDSMASWHGLRRSRADLDDYGDVFLVVDNWGALVRSLPELEAEITELAATGLHYGVHLVLSANRWAELRPALRDNLGGRLELRLNDPLESEFGRALAGALPRLPGRGLAGPGLQFQAAEPGPAEAVLGRARGSERGAMAPPLRLLPALLREEELPAPGPGQPAGIPFAVEEHRLEPVWLNLFEGSPHLLILGDAECGKTGLLRLVAHRLAGRYRPDQVAIVVVDLRRRLLDLARLPQLAGYACAPGDLAETIDHLRARLLDRPALLGDPTSSPIPGSGLVGPNVVPEASAGAVVRAGPRYVVLVDDYDLLPGTTGSPLAPLLDLLGQGRELGLHLVVARGVAGSARASFEPVFQRLRELGGPGLIMSGDPAEGPLLGGQRASVLPPGRGLLVRRRHPPTLVQVAHCPPPAGTGVVRSTGGAVVAARRPPAALIAQPTAGPGTGAG